MAGWLHGGRLSAHGRFQRLAALSSGRPDNGAGDRELSGAIAPAQNLDSTTMARRMASPAVLYMKGMVGTTRLGCGAGVAAPCRFSGAASLSSRPPAARARRLSTLGSPDWRAARHQAAIGRGIGRDRALSMMHSTPIACRMASPGGLCIRSVRGTPGLGSGAGVGAPCSIPVTLPAQTRHAGSAEHAQQEPRLPMPREPPRRASTTSRLRAQHVVTAPAPDEPHERHVVPTRLRENDPLQNAVAATPGDRQDDGVGG